MKPAIRPRRWLPLLLLWPALSQAATGAAAGFTDIAFAGEPVHDDGFALSLLGVTVNGADQDLTTTFPSKDGVLYIGAGDLAKLRIRPPRVAPVMNEGKAYYPVTALAGVTVSVDSAAQVARFTVPAQAFEGSDIDASRRKAPPLSPAVFSSFLNYDVAFQADPTGNGVSGLLEHGIAGDWGVLVNTAVAANVPGASYATRMDSTFTRDDPARLTRLSLGDGITRVSDWARPIRFGGVQYGTNFGLQPNFVSFPTPSFAGRTTLPSSVEAFANGVLTYQGEVDQGPFSLNQIPTTTGAGDLSFVVKDQLGVEHTVTTSYYTSPRLLQPGLEDYSFEAGAERNNYAIENFDYGDPFASVTYRRGLGSRTTLEYHAEISNDSRTQGGGLAWVWPALGEFAGSAAASNSRAGTGVLGKLSYTRLARWLSFAASYTRTSERFVQLGGLAPAQRITSQAQVSGGITLGRYGSFNLAYGALRYGDGTRLDVETLNYNLTLFKDLFFNAYLISSRDVGVPVLGGVPGSALGGTGSITATFGAPSVDAGSSGRTTTVGFIINIPFGTRSNASLQGYHRDHQYGDVVSLQRNPPSDTGFGYLLSTTHDQTSQSLAQVSWQDDHLMLMAQGARLADQTSGRLIASGGMGYAAGDLFLSRRIEDGFGVVSIPGYPDVTVYQENRPTARTNANGLAIIPMLRAYDVNHISIDSGSLPLDANIASDALTLTPRYRGAALASFQVNAIHGLSLSLVLPDGSALPPGVALVIGGQSEAGFTGYDGVVFLTNVAAGTGIDAHWGAHHCHAVLPAIPAGETLPDLGKVSCTPAAAP